MIHRMARRDTARLNGWMTLSRFRVIAAQSRLRNGALIRSMRWGFTSRRLTLIESRLCGPDGFILNSTTLVKCMRQPVEVEGYCHRYSTIMSSQEGYISTNIDPSRRLYSDPRDIASTISRRSIFIARRVSIGFQSILRVRLMVD